MSNSKVIWVDAMKGIGILTVVIGHIYEGYLKQSIFIFHMPLFFFLAGFLFTIQSSFKIYLIKKVKHLLLPYFVYLGLIYFSTIDLTSYDLIIIIKYFFKPLIGGKLIGGVFWFITCLFLTQLLTYFLTKCFSYKTQIFIVGICLIISDINAIWFPSFWLPWNGHVVFVALPFFYVGYLFKTYHDVINKDVFLLLGIIVLIISIFLSTNTYDMKYSIYGIPIVTFISAIILIINVKTIAEYIAAKVYLNSIFSFLGRGSMVIMYVHQQIQLTINKYFTTNLNVRLLGAIVVSLLFYYLLNQFTVTRALFMGSIQDFDIIQEKWKKLFFNVIKK